MKKRERRDLIINAVHALDYDRIDALIELCMDAERAREILNKKGYGLDCTSCSATAAQVPEFTRSP